MKNKTRVYVHYIKVNFPISNRNELTFRSISSLADIEYYLVLYHPTH